LAESATKYELDTARQRMAAAVEREVLPFKESA
jgi:hypothetical protein